MFKICTDPTVYPIREVDLTSAAGGLTLTPSAMGESRDMTWQRSDGGLNVARRARRIQAELEAAIITSDQAQKFQEVLGLTAGGAPRGPAYLFPPWDASTILSAPFQGSLAAYRKRASVGALERVDVGFSRASIGYYADRWGRWSSVAAGVPRFGPGPLGQVIQVERPTTNLLSSSHPTAGSLGWTAGAGTPTLEWTTDERSPYRDAGGCLRVRRATSGSCQLYATNPATVSSATNTRLRVSVWVRGAMEGTIQSTVGAQVEVTGSLVSYADRWTRWDLEFAKDDAATTCSVLLSVNDNGSDRAFYVGPSMVTQYDDQLYQEPPQFWTPTSSNKDDLGVIVENVPGGFTFSVASHIPPRPVRSRYWWLGGGTSDHMTTEWAGNGLRWWVGNQYVQLNPPTAEWDAAVGRPCVVTCVLTPSADATSVAADLVVAYTLADGGPVRRWSVQDAAASVGDYTDATDLTLGSFGAWEPGALGLSWVRYDGRAWSTIQREVWERCILEAGFRDVFALTQGRQFLLGDLELETIPGTVYQRARIDARETSRDDDLAVYV